MKLILASKSLSRRNMLDAAGIKYQAIPADIDERAVEAGLDECGGGELAEALSIAKAHAISCQNIDDLILGSDSLIICDGRRFDKPSTREEAGEHLRFFSGRVMQLYSAAALLRGNICEWSHSECAQLHVRELSEEFIQSYLDLEWPQVGHCVGVFRIEGRGVQLFERIEGDHFTISGMPLLPLLSALRENGMIIA